MLDARIGSPQRHDALTIFPLVTTQRATLDYTLLADPGAAVRVDELGEGVVPTLSAWNEGASDVLLVDGEQLIGAKQNRMVNRSMVLPAKTRIDIPVSCIEQGRWHHRGVAFTPAPQHSPASVRRRVRESERGRVRAGMAADAASLAMAQGDVWSAVSEVSSGAGTHSNTDALNDAYDARRVDLERVARSFPPVDGQIGVLVFAGEQPLGLDLIGGRRLYARLHERMLRGWLMEAMSRRAFAQPGTVMMYCGRPIYDGEAQAFLDRARSARRAESPTVGRGSYAVLDGDVIGGALVDRGRIVHLAAFPAAA